MRRGKIEHKTKREKWDFCLGGMQEKRESKVGLREDTKRVCAKANKDEAAQERKRRESSQEGVA